MQQSLLPEIETFMAETGLSEHRAGILLANNGRLVERLRDEKRIWPETEIQVRQSLARERAKRLARQDGAV